MGEAEKEGHRKYQYSDGQGVLERIRYLHEAEGDGKEVWMLLVRS